MSGLWSELTKSTIKKSHLLKTSLFRQGGCGAGGGDGNDRG
ncbi:hypothetical protein [Rubritalea tangerina]